MLVVVEFNDELLNDEEITEKYGNIFFNVKEIPIIYFLCQSQPPDILYKRDEKGVRKSYSTSCRFS